MSTTPQYTSTSPSRRAHDHPDHNRVTRLNKLADNITELVAHLDAGAYRLLMLIYAFDENEGWEGPGIRSCAHWLNWKCGISMGSARERVRVARALPGLPGISAAFRQGQVSYSKVRAMTRVATPENEAALLQVALNGTASHVETQVRLYRKVKRIAVLQQENLRHAHRELSWYIDDDGYWVYKGRFTFAPLHHGADGLEKLRNLKTLLKQLVMERRIDSWETLQARGAISPDDVLHKR